MEEKCDRHETENERGILPEPDILMEDDQQNDQSPRQHISSVSLCVSIDFLSNHVFIHQIKLISVTVLKERRK